MIPDLCPKLCHNIFSNILIDPYFQHPLIDYLVNIQQMKMSQMQQSSSQQQDQLQQQQLQQVVLAYAYLITGAHFRS